MNISSEAPQDSVLRRHWEAAQAQPSMAGGTASQAATSNNTSSGGFFSWLKSLFS